MTDKYIMEEESRDAATVARKLGLDSQPITVEMVGREVIFRYPVPTEEEDGSD